MQNLTDAPRDTLTADQVTYLLRDSPSITPVRGLEVLDLNLNVLEDISGDFLGGQVTRNNLATVHGTCALTIARDVDYGLQLLRPYMTLTTDGISARFNGGVYVPRKPATDYGSSILSNAITGSDRLFQLNRPVGNAYTVAKGTGYLDAIRQVLVNAGIAASNVLLDSTATAATLPKDRTWPLLVDSSVADVAPVDAIADDNAATSWLRVANDLLAAIGYRGLWADWDGNFRGDRYLTPSSRPVEFTFDFDDPLRNVVATPRTRNRDTSAVPNVWIFRQQNLVDGNGTPVEPVEGAGQYTVTNQSDGDTSIDARGGTPLGRWVSVVPLDVADQTSLVTAGNQQAAAAQQVATTWQVSTSPFPAAWHEDVLAYSDIDAAGGLVKVLSNGWTLDYGTSTTPPSDQQHAWQLIA